VQAQQKTDEQNIATLQTTVSAIQTQQKTDEQNIATLQTGLSAVQAQQTTDEQNIANLQTGLSAVQAQQKTDEQNIATLQTTVSAVQAQQKTDEQNIATLQTTVSAIQTQQTADVNAISALQASVSSIGNAFAKRVSLSGPLTVSVNSNNSYTITDYDSNAIYNVSVTAGAVYLNGNEIIFTTPATVQNVTLTVNLNQYLISVVSTIVQTPSIISPANGTIGVYQPITLKATNYQYIGSPSYPQGAASWQVATDSAFSNIVFQSIADPVNLNSITLPNLNTNTVYFARVKYGSTNNIISNYSAVVSFTTPAFTYPKATTGSLIFTSALDSGSYTYYASSLSVNANGTLAAAGRQVLSKSSGKSNYAIAICQYTSGVWNLKYKIPPQNNVFRQAFGSNVKISYDGTFLLTSDWAQNNGLLFYYLLGSTQATSKQIISPTGSNLNSEFNSLNILLSSNQQTFIVGSYLSNSGNGRVLVYTFNTGTSQWNSSAAQIILPPQTVTSSNFGYTLAGNIDLSTIAISAPLYNNSAGCVVVYQYSSGAYSQIALLTASDGLQGDLFGQSKFAMSQDGNYIAIGAPGANGSAGKVYIYTKTNGVYSQTQILEGSDSAINDQFGISIEFNNNDTYLYVGAPYNSYNGNTSAGAVYIFQNNSGSFSQISKITNSGSSGYYNLGYTISMGQSGTTLLAAAPGNNYGSFIAIN
jgi:hypothetical protein